MPLVKFENGKVLQVEVPHKCGSTTVFRMFSHLQEAYGAEYWKISQQSPYHGQADYAVAIVRDPVERMKSCYWDRIVNRGKAGEQYSWDYFVSNLNQIREQASDIKIHTLPHTWRLGNDPDFYNEIVNTAELSKRIPKIIQKLSGIAVAPVKAKRSANSKGKDTPINAEHKKLIKEYFKDDYALYGNYF
jgi:hypothetical protein